MEKAYNKEKTITMKENGLMEKEMVKELKL